MLRLRELWVARTGLSCGQEGAQVHALPVFGFEGFLKQLQHCCGVGFRVQSSQEGARAREL